MEIIDTHCDVLWKLQQFEKEGKTVSFQDHPLLQVNMERMQKGKIKIQCFAIFIEDSVPVELKWQEALGQIEIFQRKIIGENSSIIHIKKWEDIAKLKEGEIGAILSLEGADLLGNDLTKMSFLQQLGILSVGLTWNYANVYADGILEERGAGLTNIGKKLIRTLNEENMLVDISHASDRATGEIIELAQHPYASHSNSRTVCAHPRNISDSLLHALFKKKGHIHLNFYPPFLTDQKRRASVEDVIRHIEYICEIGGEDYIGFGSDFDGIDQVAKGMAHAAMYDTFIDTLMKYYSESQVEKFTSKNFLRFVERIKKEEE